MSIDDLAAAALPRFGLSEDATATLCNVSENHTYRVEDPASGLRAARPPPRLPHRAADRVRAALGRRAARGRCGRHLRRRSPRRPASGCSTCTTATSCCGSGCPGAEPDPEGDAVLDGFRVLGAVSARMHAHARAWTPPAGFDRPPGTTTTRSAPTAVGPLAGRPRHRRRGARAARAARRGDPAPPRGATGSRPERFGLVHADIRLANLLVDGGHDRRHRLRRLRLRVVPVRLRDHGLVHRGPPARARAARRLARRLPLGRAALRRRRGRARHLRDAAPPAAGGVDRLAPHVRDRGRGARRRLHHRHLRAGGALPVNPLPRRPDVHPSHRPHRPRHRRHARASARASPASSRARAPTW